MSGTKAHINFYKTAVVILLLAFSLSPCAVKRDLLGIFDIEHINTFNKVKITVNSSVKCDNLTKNFSTKISTSKADFKLKNKDFSFILFFENFKEEKTLFNQYSKHSSGNSPPKYILFKRLKLHLI